MLLQQPKFECSSNEKDLIELALNLYTKGELPNCRLFPVVQRIWEERNANKIRKHG